MNGLTALFGILAGLVCSTLTGCTDRGVRAAVVSDAPPGRHEAMGSLHLVRVAVGADSLTARMFVAAGDGPHPTLLLLHDRPDIELHLDLAHAARRAGWNVLAPHDPAVSSGAHDADPEPLERTTGVARASLAWLRSSEAAARYRVDPGRLAVLGHGIGGVAALRTATSDTSLVAAGSLAGYGPAGWEATDRASAARPPSSVPSGELLDLARRLGHRPVLLLATSDDSVAPVARHHAPVVKVLRRRGPWVLVHRVLDADHHFTRRRIELATAVVGWLRVVDRTWVRSAKID